MEKIYLIFDYFKKAFHINRDNKKIYIPQISLISIKALMILIAGISIYRWIGKIDFFLIDAEDMFRFFISNILMVSALIMIYAILSVIFESGLFNMYKRCVLGQKTVSEDFWEGVKKYSLRFLLGNILVIIMWLIISPLFIFVGIVTLFIGFSVISILISVFLTMWKVSLVMNDTGIISAFKDSFKFAKRHFWPLSVLKIIQWAFSSNAYSNSSFNINYNFNNFNNINNINNTGDIINRTPINGNIDTDLIIKIFKTIFAILIPVITISTFISSLIAMIFKVFFSLVLFVVYTNNFENEDNTPKWEVA